MPLRPPSRATVKLELLAELRRQGLYPYAYDVTKNSSYPDVGVFQDAQMRIPVEVIALKALSIVPHSEAYDAQGEHTRASSRSISRNDIWGELVTGSDWGVPVRLIAINLMDGSRFECPVDPRTFTRLSLTAGDFRQSTKSTVTPLSGEQREAQSVSWQGQGKPEERQEVQPNKASGQSSSDTRVTASPLEANKDDKDSQPARRVYGLAPKRTYGNAHNK